MLESTPLGRYPDLHDNNVTKHFEKYKKQMTEKGSMTVGNSDGTNDLKSQHLYKASIFALRREKQAKLRLGWGQHGEKSLKFHSINSIEEYAKNLIS